MMGASRPRTRRRAPAASTPRRLRSRVRDAETYARAGSTTSPDLNATDLAVRNILFVDVPVVFETGNGRFAFDLTANNLVHNTTANTAALFTALPSSTSGTTTESAFDWQPPPSSPAASGGSAVFSGKIATKATGASASGHMFAATSYVGAAAPPGTTGATKWWSGWTRYAQD